MKRLLFTLSVLLVLSNSKLSAQNVGIGTSTPAQKLDVIGNIRSSTLAGVGLRAVLADPTGTLTIATGLNSPAWLTTGNTGTNPALHFLGTTDPTDLVFRTTNTERMRLTGAGNLGVGTTIPLAKIHAEVLSGVAIRGSLSGFGSGFLGYTGSIALGAFGTTPGAVMFSEEAAASANPSLIAVTRSPATYAANIAYSNAWISGYFGTDNASATANPPGLYSQLNVTTNFTSGAVFQSAVRGYMNRGAIAGNGAFSVGVQGVANSQSQDAFGVIGQTFCNTLSNLNSGGYFEANTYAAVNNAFAYVANSGLNRKITGSGAVSEIIPTENHGRITLTCPESPEYWYEDYGTVQLVNGRAHVDLDPILADIIFVTNDHPIRVFATPVDMLNFNGVAVTNRTATGFDLVELNGGTNSGTVDYHLVVKPKTNFGEGRFRQAPGPAASKIDPPKARAKNNPNPAEIFRWPSDNVVYDYKLPEKGNVTMEKSETNK